MQYLKLSDEVLFDKSITSNEFRVYSILLRLYNTEKECAYPSMEYISESTGISLSTVKRSIKKLTELGYITIVKKQSVNGNFNTYTNLIHLVPDEVPTKKVPDEVPTKKVPDEVPGQIIVSDYKESGVQLPIPNIDEVPELSEYTVLHQQKISIVQKQGINLTEKQMDIIGDMDLETLRESIRIFKKKKGKYFSFLVNLYLDIAEKNEIEISKDIEKYLCGSYIKLTEEEKETQKALMELEIYGVPVF